MRNSLDHGYLMSAWPLKLFDDYNYPVCEAALSAIMITRLQIAFKYWPTLRRIIIRNYHKIPKYSRKICCNPPKVQTKWLYHRVTHPKDAHGMANSVDPDGTAPV